MFFLEIEKKSLYLRHRYVNHIFAKFKYEIFQ